MIYKINCQCQMSISCKHTLHGRQYGQLVMQRSVQLFVEVVDSIYVGDR